MDDQETKLTVEEQEELRKILIKAYEYGDYKNQVVLSILLKLEKRIEIDDLPF